MRIPIVAGIGRGSTFLSAFDDALADCGVLNYNLIPLSSVIPSATQVVPLERFISPRDEHGHRLYVVKAEMRSDQSGQVVGAAVGWYQWGDDRGVFVEFEAAGWTKQAVATELDYRICNSLRDLCAVRAVSFELHRVESKKIVADVEDQPTCALILAIYQSAAWR